ncbi:MAG: nuclear transport factor 2 family protein [Anaerolineales bacterium]|nr:nuclear transport factor 2 family protein [Chloroflexota bacterium]MBL6981799.1 nuclear transport factor 2 family protein [Anaerolineales bacterium]
MTDRQALGIDINQYARRGGTNFGLARDHIQAGVYDFVIIKVGLGFNKVDIFDEQVNGCIQHDIPWTTYHFPDPELNMVNQAKKYVDWMGSNQKSYIVDIESPRVGTPPPTRNQMRSYLGELETLIGKKPILYSNIDVLSTIGFINDARQYPLWIARYLYIRRLWPLQKKLYKKFDNFVDDHAWEIPSTATDVGLGEKVILWQFTHHGDGRFYIYNRHTNDPRFPDGMVNADLNISIKKRDEFMSEVFGDVHVDISARYIDALNSRDPNQVVDLYSDLAVHTNAQRSIHGKDNIRGWYQALFNQTLPNGRFTRTGFTASGNSRTFSWTAQADSGQVLDGNDTLGLMNDEIVFHFTHFSVT